LLPLISLLDDGIRLPKNELDVLFKQTHVYFLGKVRKLVATEPINVSARDVYEPHGMIAFENQF